MLLKEHTHNSVGFFFPWFISVSIRTFTAGFLVLKIKIEMSCWASCSAMGGDKPACPQLCGVFDVSLGVRWRFFCCFSESIISVSFLCHPLEQSVRVPTTLDTTALLAHLMEISWDAEKGWRGEGEGQITSRMDPPTGCIIAHFCRKPAWNFAEDWACL